MSYLIEEPNSDAEFLDPHPIEGPIKSPLSVCPSVCLSVYLPVHQFGILFMDH